jgi:predicted ATPase/DNA-binding SARP family transcriptional activator
VPPYVRLLGRPEVESEGAPVEPPFGKAWALLVVLAANGGWVDREELVYLLWPEHDEARARANLRKLLSRNVAALPFAGGLEAEPTRLRWPVPCDVVAFRAALADGRLAQALALYRGPFLHGLRTADLPDLEDWIATQREELAGLWRDAGTTLAAQAAAEGRVDDAVRVLRTLTDADPLDEEVLQAYLRALAAAGRGAAAEGAFRAFAERLARDIGADPSPATRALAEQASAAPVAAEVRAAPRAGARGLPKHATPFVGRAAERARLAEVLRDPDCRLVTITAPGGFGKTRLALAVAAELASEFGDGVAFVPFAAVHEVAQVPFTLADAIGLTLTGNRAPLEQLADALAGRRQLVVLDNLEHLLDDVGWLTTLIEASPDIRWLVTSRERLDLEGEWRFELRGLALPREGEPPEASDAVRLFLQRAARERAEAATPAAIASALRICRAVEGMPLALDLAAAWAGTLDLDELADEIERDLDLLVASARSKGDRQRSVTAVFEASLARLGETARCAFEGLGVFPGSFDRAAAAAVAGATPPVLRDLSARSLLGASGGGRFRLHELLRRHAASRLAADPVRDAAVREVHARHYAAWLQASESALHGTAPAATLAQLDLERDNVMASWHWHVEERDVVTVPRLAKVLETYLGQRTRFAEGVALFGGAAAAFDAPGDDVARAVAGGLLVQAGWLAFRGGRYQEARSLGERAPALLGTVGDPVLAAEGAGLLGACTAVRGDYLAALPHFERALPAAQRSGQAAAMSVALNNLAITEKQLGRYRDAERHYREALGLVRRTGPAVSLARALNNLGLLLLADERPTEAEPILREGLELALTIEALQVVPHLLGGLAKSALARGDYAAARAAADEASRRTRAAGARGSLGPVLCTLALAAAGEGDAAAADRALMDAVVDASETGNPASTLMAVASAGRVRSARGEHRAALLAFALVADDPRLEHALRSELRPAWQASIAAAGEGAAAAAAAEAETLGLDGVLAALGLSPDR